MSDMAGIIMVSTIVIMAIVLLVSLQEIDRLMRQNRQLKHENMVFRHKYMHSFRDGVSAGMRSKIAQVIDKPCNIKISGDYTECLSCGNAWDTNDQGPPTCIFEEKAV